MADKIQLDAILNLVDVKINPQVFRKISQAVAGMPNALNKTNTHLQGIASTSQTVNKQLSRTGQQLSTNERAARLFLQRMAQFAILLPTFATLNRAIQGSVSFLFEFDSALRDVVRIDVGNLASRIEEIGDAALKTATDFGVSATEVLNTIRVFKQAGDTIEQSQERARVAILATQISTLSAAQATEVFIAASRQFGEEGQNSASVLDKLAKVEDIAAVNAADVADAFRTGGNSLAAFGKSLDDSIGLIAALTEQTRKSGREVGTFFKTFQTRVFAAGEARDAVESLGVEVQNLDGTLRPTLDVLNDLKTRFDGLTEAQQANAAKAIAGVRQFESLIAVLNSLDDANQFARESALSAGTAEEKRAITDAKLERQLGKLVAQGQKLAEAIGDAGLEDALSGALKVATALLKAFTSLADLVSDIGGNLTPLLALGGVTLGKSVFGINKGKEGAPPTPGQTSFIGPLNQQGLILTQTFKDNIKQVGLSSKGIAQSTAGIVSSFTKSSQVVNAQGVVMGVNLNTLKQHTASLKANVQALRLNADAAFRKGVGKFQSGPGLVLGTLLGATLPAAFTKASESLRSFDSKVADTGAKFLDLTSDGTSLAFQFAALGPAAAVAAFAFGTLKSVAVDFVNAVEDQTKALDEIEAQNKETAARGKNDIRLTGRSEKSLDLQAALLQSLQAGVAGKSAGKELAAGIEEGFKGFTKTKEAQEGLFTTNERVRAGLFKNIDAFKTFIGNNKDLIASMADSDEQLQAFNELQELLANGTNADLGPAFNKLLITLGATVPSVNEFTGVVEEARKSFEDIQRAIEVRALADEIRTLGLELELAKAGPEALADAVVRMKNELLIAERESENSLGRIEEELGAFFERLDEKSVGLNPAGISAAEFFTRVNKGVESLNPEVIAEFEDFINSLPKVQQQAAEQILKLIKDRYNEELSLQKQRNDLEEEQSKRAKDLLEEESKAQLNAYEAARKFNAELQHFGDAVTNDVLSAFQNISLGDVKDALGGKSDLGEGIQQIIQSAFGEDKGATRIAKAQTELQAVAADTQAELDVLAKKLEMVNEKLADQANAADFATLTGEKRSLELDIETAKQKGALDAVQAKIKVLEAERKAEEEAEEAARKRADLLEKLADASRKFDNELRDIKRDFEDFTQKRFGELLDEEADARNDLKEAQQETLDATKELADAYDELIKAYYEFNGVIAEARIKSNLLGRDIAALTGGIFTFDQGLASLNNAFTEVLNDANISLSKRIDLERQLAEETLNFLKQARDEIVQAGIGIFGQTGQENQALGQGIAGLQFVADQLGGSFENFLNLTGGELSDVTQVLLGLPVEFRQQILDALNFLPSTTNIGGFSVEQLTQAIGQIGAGVAPEVGLPSIEELNSQQVEQLQKLQELALQDAQLQFAQVFAAQEQVAKAQEAVDAAQILQERASEKLEEVRNAVQEEAAILDLANTERQELIMSVIEADDRNTLMQIEKEAQLFAEQNSAFREVGDLIVRGVAAAISGRLAVLEATQNLNNAAKGFIPNFAGGNISPKEAAGLLRAAAREKRAMPAGAGLAVANTKEAIIPMSAGFVPNFQGGNEIAAGISAIRSINETVVAAIAQSVTTALSDLQGGGGRTEELLQEVITQLSTLNDLTDDINTSNATVAANTATDTGGTGTTTTNPVQRVEISLQTNQNNAVTITGLDSLRDELEAAVMNTTAEQVDAQTSALFSQLSDVITALQERGILSSFGQTR
jgi:TP901 family phage tail tape measure protein